MPKAASPEAKEKPSQAAPHSPASLGHHLLWKGQGFCDITPPPSRVTKAAVIRALDNKDCSVFNKTQTTRITFFPLSVALNVCLWSMVLTKTDSKAALTLPLSTKTSGHCVFQKLLKFFFKVICVYLSFWGLIDKRWPLRGEQRGFL